MTKRICWTCQNNTIVGICLMWDNYEIESVWHCKYCCDKMHPHWRPLDEVEEFKEYINND